MCGGEGEERRGPGQCNVERRASRGQGQRTATRRDASEGRSGGSGVSDGCKAADGAERRRSFRPRKKPHAFFFFARRSAPGRQRKGRWAPAPRATRRAHPALRVLATPADAHRRRQSRRSLPIAAVASVAFSLAGIRRTYPTARAPHRARTPSRAPPNVRAPHRACPPSRAHPVARAPHRACAPLFRRWPRALHASRRSLPLPVRSHAARPSVPFSGVASRGPPAPSDLGAQALRLSSVGGA